MALGVVFTAGLMVTLYFIDFAAFNSIKASDEEGQALNEKFASHLARTNVNFESKEEHAKRFEIFKVRDAQIEAHNLKADKKYSKVHNEFSMMTEEEMTKFKGHHAYFAGDVSQLTTF